MGASVSLGLRLSIVLPPFLRLAAAGEDLRHEVHVSYKSINPNFRETEPEIDEDVDKLKSIFSPMERGPAPEINDADSADPEAGGRREHKANSFEGQIVHDLDSDEMNVDLSGDEIYQLIGDSDSMILGDGYVTPEKMRSEAGSTTGTATDDE